MGKKLSETYNTKTNSLVRIVVYITHTKPPSSKSRNTQAPCSCQQLIVPIISPLTFLAFGSESLAINHKSKLPWTFQGILKISRDYSYGFECQASANITQGIYMNGLGLLYIYLWIWQFKRLKV